MLITQRGQWEEEPLALAARHGQVASVALLLKAGCHEWAIGEALDKAVENGHEACVALLLEAECPESGIGGALCIAARNGAEACVALLLKAGCSEEKTIRRRPLHRPQAAASAPVSTSACSESGLNSPVYPLAQFFTGLKMRHVLAAQRHCVAGSGVPTLSGLTIMEGKTAEASDLDSLSR